MRNALIQDMVWLSGDNIDKVAKLVKEWQQDVSFKIVHFNELGKDNCPYVPLNGYEILEDVYHYNGWYYLALIYKITRPKYKITRSKKPGKK